MSIIKVGQIDVYYEIENMTIGRKPSKSNLKEHGSDNSLYIGLKTNEQISDMLCKMFNYKDILEFHDKSFQMKSHGGIEVLVTTNINKDGQLQIKINKNGMMHEIYNEFLLDSMEDINPNDIIIVVDFKKMNVRVRKISDFRL